MKKNIFLIAFSFLSFSNVLVAQQTNSKPNILFIAIDDLKPELGCYGNKLIKTPNIDRLAAMGTVFMSNYCQQAVCGPTRASLMTGKRPDYTKVWDLKTPMRDVNPDILSLPQYLITQGYTTQGIGKVYDPRDVDKQLDAPSWSVPFYKVANKYYDKKTGPPVLGQYQSDSTRLLFEKYTNEAKANGLTGKEARLYVEDRVKPTTECIDVPDNAYDDGANVLMALDILKELKGSDKPFFFAVGIHKPHLPFVSPKKYWDLYKREDMPLAQYQEAPKNYIAAAFSDVGEMKKYTDIPALLSFTDQKPYGLTLPADKQKELIHGYYAAISYTDALVGKLLNTLDSLGLTKNTIIVLWGDHGWHLGDHNMWCKHTNFEQATHTPLIISAPGIKPAKTNSMTEFVDIFPTLCDLTGSKIPAVLDGKSLVSVMKDPKSSVKDFAVSQYPRNVKENGKNMKYMGYSIRTSQYRYTLWMGNDFRTTQPFSKDLVKGIELYDYKKDPLETNNVSADKDYEKVATELNKKILDFFKSQLDIK